MEDLLYWIIEYSKVILGYGVLMFLWPTAVFRKFLNGKSLTFRFSFCLTVQIVIVNTVVLMLGLFHILNRFTIWGFFGGVFLWSFREKLKITKEIKRKFKYLITGTFGWKHFTQIMLSHLWRWLQNTVKTVWKIYCKHFIEYTILVLLVAYGMLYFSWGALHDHSYGFSDMYVHHSWIYGLTEGKAFSAGIYPEGMHCLVYSLYALFGIRIFNCMLFLPAANTCSVLVAIYCLMKELYRNRFTAVAALMIFLTLGVSGRYIMIGMARMQCSLPQEIGFPAIFICVLYLIKYLRSESRISYTRRFIKIDWNAELLIFIFALAATIIVHFYATFMAFFLCLAVAIVYIRKIFTKNNFRSLVAAVVCGILIAAIPMVIGFATGIPLQGSLTWGMGIIKQSTELPVINSENVQVSANNSATSEQAQMKPEEMQPMGSPGAYEYVNSPIPVYEESTLLEKGVAYIQGIRNKICGKAEDIYTKGYVKLYGENQAHVIILLSMFGVLFWGIYRIVCMVANEKFKKNWCSFAGDGILIIVVSSFVYIIAYVAKQIGLPALLESSRIGFITHLTMVMVMAIPFEMVFSLLRVVRKNVLYELSATVLMGGCLYAIVLYGYFHSYLYFEVTRYNSAVNVTNKIIDTMPQYSYTIVSPTDELYHVIEYGRHEELLTFLENQTEEVYTLPTEYVFVFVEKQAIKYAQYHFFDGPDWLGQHKYQEIYGSYSVWPEYISYPLSDELAQYDIRYFDKESDSYLNAESRTIIQSKMDKWCRKFDTIYPNELKTLYEDEYFACYYWKQNQQHLYNLAMD